VEYGKMIIFLKPLFPAGRRPRNTLEEKMAEKQKK
jgi:hypothetical protein